MHGRPICWGMPRKLTLSTLLPAGRRRSTVHRRSELPRLLQQQHVRSLHFPPASLPACACVSRWWCQTNAFVAPNLVAKRYRSLTSRWQCLYCSFSSPFLSMTDTRAEHNLFFQCNASTDNQSAVHSQSRSSPSAVT